MSGYPSLKNCMLKQEAHVSTFCGEVFQYSPVATTFLIYYCTLESITMLFNYDNIFTGKQEHHNVHSILVPARSYLQTGLNHTDPLGLDNRTLVIHIGKSLLRRLTIVTTAKPLPTNTTISVYKLMVPR